ncbi:MAG TPA: rhodanese-like domain-containing protein [Desulfobacterales bacterium]|nr:rhodanese-like domain-containing protein [Desulfobacterales bacterium]
MSPTLSPSELKKLLDSKSVTLVDVRRKADYEAEPNLIPSAAWRDPEQVESWSRELPKGRPVVVYCVKGGSVSQSITATLTGKQVDARFVEGGLKAWKEAGGNLEKTK